MYLSKVSWLKNGANLNLVPGQLTDRIGMSNSFELVLTEIQYGDAGQYVCHASNINGEAFNMTIVTVVGKSKMFKCIST